MGMRYRLLNKPEDYHRLLSWWESLDNNRGDRARLRRAERPDDVLLTEPFFRFMQQMPEEWANPKNLFSSAIVAGALSHVKEHLSSGTFATQLAFPKQGGERHA